MLQKEIGEYVLVKDNVFIKLYHKEKGSLLFMIRFSDYPLDILMDIIDNWFKSLGVKVDKKKLLNDFFFRI